MLPNWPKKQELTRDNFDIINDAWRNGYNKALEKCEQALADECQHDWVAENTGAKVIGAPNYICSKCHVYMHHNKLHKMFEQSLAAGKGGLTEEELLELARQYQPAGYLDTRGFIKAILAKLPAQRTLVPLNYAEIVDDIFQLDIRNSGTATGYQIAEMLCKKYGTSPTPKGAS